MATTHANVRDADALPPAGGDQPGGQEPPEGLLSMARGRLRTELNARKNLVSDTLTGVAESVRRVGEPLREQSASIAGYTDKAAERLAELATGLRDRDVAELADDVAAFARQHPGAFVAGGLAAGILAARFLKSSAPGRADQAGAGRAAAEAKGNQRPAAGARRLPRRQSESMQARSSAEGERHG